MILGCLPIILGILLHFITTGVDPERPSFIYPLISTPQGQMMLMLALMMQVVGGLAIWKIVNIRV